jgi:hypothetical protein
LSWEIVRAFSSRARLVVYAVSPQNAKLPLDIIALSISTLDGKTLLRNIGGAEGDRTPDLMTASHALSQLSYGPFCDGYCIVNRREKIAQRQKLSQADQS